MLEYDPAHKTSSITSTSTASTWDHPFSNDYNQSHKKQDDTTCLEEYSGFDDLLVSERIAIPPFEYFEDEQTNSTTTTATVDENTLFDMFNQDGATAELPELLLPSPSIIKKDLISSSHNSAHNKNENLISQSYATYLEPIYLQQGHQMTLSSPSRSSSTTSSDSSSSKQVTKRKRVILQPKDASSTNDEKRANHIVSEQKRRNAIRTGFKELTDLIPTLKNINNFKSTILFKAVEFMKHLEKRNRTLSDKVKSLKMKLEVQGKVQKSNVHQKRKQFYLEHPMLPPDTISALIAHKNQQKQLELLQNQLRVQHQLLQKHNIISPFDNSLFHQQKSYNSILIPSSRSSEGDENEQRQPWSLSN